jgi:glutathione peroxidase
MRIAPAWLAVLTLCAACKKDDPAPRASSNGPATAIAKKETTVNLPAAGTPPPAVPAPADFGAIWDLPLHTLQGADTSLAAFKGKAVLVVNVASKCGLTPQYAALEALQDKYAAKGFTVVGFPCNQFGGQEPGTSEQIAEFCSATYGVTFPMMEKTEVNGAGRSPVYAKLTPIADATGHTGDIRWNFEKFLISADGTKITRFDPKTAPDNPAVIGAIEQALPR